MTCHGSHHVPNIGLVCRYGDGTIRLTVEQDILWPNVPEKNLEAMQKEPLFQKFKIFPGNLEGSLVSCTGAQVPPPPLPPSSPPPSRACDELHYFAPWTARCVGTP